MQTYFENDFVTIGYDNVNHVIVLKWIIAPTSAEFREGLNSLIPAMEYFKTGKVIVDTTYLGVIHPDDQHWSATEWTEKAIKAGYTHLAVVLPSEIFTQMSVEDTMSQVVGQLTYANFESIENALEWITQRI